MEAITSALSVLLVLVGAIGTVVPGLPGLPLIWVGFMVRSYQTDFTEPSITTLVVTALLVGLFSLGQLLTAPIATKLAGGTKAGMIGAALGLVLGILTSFSLISLFLFPLLGAVIGELSSGASRKQAVKSGLGTIIAFLVTTATEFALGLALATWFVIGLL